MNIPELSDDEGNQIPDLEVVEEYDHFIQITKEGHIIEDESSEGTLCEEDGEQISCSYETSEEDYSSDPPTNLTLKERLIEVSKINYMDIFINIFTDSLNPRRRRFFFEPVVLLDRKHIVIVNFDLFKQDVIRFTVQMWDQDLRYKVLERLRSMPEFSDQKIGEDDIFVLPFEDVHLVYKPGTIPDSVQLFNRPISYLLMPKSLHFYLLSNSYSVALDLFEDFRRHPDYSLKKWQLSLVGRGLVLGKEAKISSSDRDVFSFNISTITAPTQLPGAVFGVVPLPRPTVKQEEVGMRSSSSNAVPVFSVKKCSNFLTTGSKSTNVAFSIFNFGSKFKHGYFHLPDGMFIVRTPGIYQFNFNSCVIVDSTSLFVRVELKVDGVVKATARSATASNLIRFEPINLTALLFLGPGDKVEICLIGGRIHEDSIHVTQFEGILFADD